jgi:hypothetical protein
MNKFSYAHYVAYGTIGDIPAPTVNNNLDNFPNDNGVSRLSDFSYAKFIADDYDKDNYI